MKNVRNVGYYSLLLLIIASITFYEHGLTEAIVVGLSCLTIISLTQVLTKGYLRIFHSYDYGMELVWGMLLLVASTGALYYLAASVKLFLMIGFVAMAWSIISVTAALKVNR